MELFSNNIYSRKDFQIFYDKKKNRNGKKEMVFNSLPIN